MPKTLTP